LARGNLEKQVLELGDEPDLQKSDKNITEESPFPILRDCVCS
jgi:hypothetical protein